MLHAQQVFRGQAARVISLALLMAVLAAHSLPLAAAVRQEKQEKADQTTEVVLPDGTEFTVVTTEEISSKTATEGDTVTFKVEEDVKINGRVVIAKDAIVKGTVSSVEQKGRMGKAGKLGIRIESTKTVDGQKLKLRASKGKEGEDKTGNVILLSLLVSPFFLLKHGKDAVIKPGTKLKVFTDQELKVQAP
jgi:hypothetical protein